MYGGETSQRRSAAEWVAGRTWRLSSGESDTLRSLMWSRRRTSAPFGDDTPPEVEAFLVAGYRRMTPAERLARTCDLSLAVRQRALSRLRSEYPNAAARELRLRLAALTIDAETMRRAFGWDPAERR